MISRNIKELHIRNTKKCKLIIIYLLVYICAFVNLIKHKEIIKLVLQIGMIMISQCALNISMTNIMNL